MVMRALDKYTFATNTQPNKQSRRLMQLFDMTERTHVPTHPCFRPTGEDQGPLLVRKSWYLIFKGFSTNKYLILNKPVISDGRYKQSCSIWSPYDTLMHCQQGEHNAKVVNISYGWKLFHRHLGSVFSSLLLPNDPGYSLLALSSRMAGYGKITFKWSYIGFEMYISIITSKGLLETSV